MITSLHWVIFTGLMRFDSGVNEKFLDLEMHLSVLFLCVCFICLFVCFCFVFCNILHFRMGCEISSQLISPFMKSKF